MLDVEDPRHDDFELWSPSEERREVCLFGRQVSRARYLARDSNSFGQTLYHRRKREANCIVGKIPKVEEKIVRNCPCSEEDFEWYVSSTAWIRHG